MRLRISIFARPVPSEKRLGTLLGPTRAGLRHPIIQGGWASQCRACWLTGLRGGLTPLSGEPSTVHIVQDHIGSTSVCWMNDEWLQVVLCHTPSP